MSDIEDIIKIPNVQNVHTINKPNVIKKIKITKLNEELIIPFLKAIINEVGKPNMTPTDASIEKTIQKIRRNKKDFPFSDTLSKIQMYEIFKIHFKDEKINDTFRRYLIKKIMRNESGVLVFTGVLDPKPDGTEFSCPKKCSYCPTETNLEGKPTQPKSYLSSEPAMLRALMSNFDMKGQLTDRINGYIKQGNINITESINESFKLECIFSGGTWESYNYDYRNKVINELYWAANTFIEERPMLSIEEEQEINMTSKFRIIGLTLETRPDFITWKSIKDYLRWGVTRIQIGVQHYDDKILEGVNRDCTTLILIKALIMLKSACLKVVCHLMPDLPGSSPELDIWMFDQAINNPDLQFDDVKVYPTAICQSSDPNLIVTSEISDWYRQGKYVPYAEKSLDDLINVLIYYKEHIQPWVRIQRMVRDIPKKSIESGYKKISNLRQIIQDKMKYEGKTCNCIRCKEIGSNTNHLKSIRLVVYKYKASGGIEYFISFQAHTNFTFYDYLKYFIFLIYYYINAMIGKKVWWNGNPNTYAAIIGFCRLRIDTNPGGGVIKVLNGCALLRELHVYGQSVSVGSAGNIGITGQHMGYGMLLVKTAEEISIQNKLKKVAVISGVGVRKYYENKCGYSLEDTFMIKHL